MACLLFFVTFGLSLYNAAQFFILSFLYLDYRFEIEWGEGPNVLFFDQLTKWGHFYFNLNDIPYSYSTYPPLFFIAQKLAFLFVPDPLLSGRLLSIISTILLFIVIFKLCNRILNHIPLAALFALQMLGIWFITFWAPLNRIDMFACLLEVTGVYLFVKYQAHRSIFKYAHVALFACTFLTKQNMIAGVAASLLVTLVIKKDLRTTLISLAIYFASLAACFFYLDQISHGESTRHLFIYTGERELEPVNICVALIFFLGALWILTSLSLSFSKIESMLRSDFSIVSVYWFTSFIYVIMIGVRESNLNYLIPTAVASILGAALASRFWIEEKKQHSGRKNIVVILILFQALTSLYCLKNNLVNRWVVWTIPGFYYAYHEVTYKKIDALIHSTSSPILSETITPLIQNHREIDWGPPPPSERLKRQWAPKKVIDNCEQKKYEFIISGSRQDKISGLRNCREKNYTTVYRSPHYDIYQTKKDLPQ